jgi:hypothetical protein
LDKNIDMSDYRDKREVNHKAPQVLGEEGAQRKAVRLPIGPHFHKSLSALLKNRMSRKPAPLSYRYPPPFFAFAV